MRKVKLAGALLMTTALLGACVPRAEPLPPPPPPPSLPPPPPPVPPPSPPPANWQDGPLSPGDWVYRAGSAPFARYDSRGAALTIRCEPGRGVALGLSGVAAPALVVRTTYGERRLQAVPGQGNETVAQLQAGDGLLDQMAFSRGRFLIQADGGTGLVIPAWPEMARVVEDCRR